MYFIYLTDKAKGFLKKLNKKEAGFILRKINSLKENPFHHVKRLEGKKLWRLRISDYRAILDIIISEHKIIVVRIGHRKNVYGNK